MKTFIAVLTATAVLSGGVQKASAGDREWATAGKILTGLAIGGVVARALEPPPTVVYAPAPQVVYSSSAPVVTGPAPVYVQPAPVVVYSAPVYYRPAPVVYVGPAYYGPRYYGYYGGPLVSFRFGFGGGGWHHHR